MKFEKILNEIYSDNSEASAAFSKFGKAMGQKPSASQSLGNGDVVKIELGGISKVNVGSKYGDMKKLRVVQAWVNNTPIGNTSNMVIDFTDKYEAQETATKVARQIYKYDKDFPVKFSTKCIEIAKGLVTHKYAPNNNIFDFTYNVKTKELIVKPDEI